MSVGNVRTLMIKASLRAGSIESKLKGWKYRIMDDERIFESHNCMLLIGISSEQVLEFVAYELAMVLHYASMEVKDKWPAVCAAGIGSATGVNRDPALV